MIKKENVYAKSIIPYNAYAIRDLMKKLDIKSLAELLELKKAFPEYNWDKVEKDIRYAEKRIELANKRLQEPEIYMTKGYENKELNKQDELNNGDILLLHSPTGHRVKFAHINHKPISLIKEELSHTIPDGRNAFIHFNRYMGTSIMPKLISAIEMYEKQIERQSSLTIDKSADLFKLDIYDKKAIVDDVYKDIVMYLIDNANFGLVWDTLSDNQKNIYISSIYNAGVNDIQTRNKVISYISNYTTLPELEEVSKGNCKVLKRFIK